MPELIDRHALLEKVYEHPQERERMTDGEWCRKCIYEAQKVEAEPVRNGRWTDNGEDKFICSACKGYVFRWFGKSDFCPRCGAQMDVTDTNVGSKGGTENDT